jgi:hypothetical protein
MQFVRLLFISFYVVILTIISWFINGKSLIGIDDANIYMVYMRNFANGHGFVYNVGGERVEGFTSLLWTLLGSIFFYISNHPEKLLIIFNVTIISYTLYIVSNYIDREAEDEFKLFSKQSLFFLGAIGVTPGFIDWTVLSLMETGLWCFLLTSISLKTIINKDNDKIKHYSTLGLLYVLLVFCRPESMLLVPFYILLNSINEYLQSKSIKTMIKWSLYTSLYFIVALTALIYWRLDYFGYPFPNTYYAKVSNSITDNIISGLKYLYELSYQKPFLLVLVSFSFWIIIKSILNKNIESNLSFIMLFSIMAISLIIPLYSGGDHFGLHRFIIPFVPIIFLSGVIILKELNFFKSRSQLILLLFLLFFSNMHNYRDTLFNRYPIHHEWDIAVYGRSNSTKLNDFFKSNEKLPSQGVLVAGGTAYGYNGETIDLLGLNNTKMAHADKIKDRNLPKNHASFNPNVYFELSPDLFWYSNCEFVKTDVLVPEEVIINTRHFYSLVFKNIQLDKRFRKGYGYYRIDNIYNQKEVLLIFANKKFVNSLDTSLYKITTIKYE